MGVVSHVASKSKTKKYWYLCWGRDAMPATDARSKLLLNSLGLTLPWQSPHKLSVEKTVL